MRWLLFEMGAGQRRVRGPTARTAQANDITDPSLDARLILASLSTLTFSSRPTLKIPFLFQSAESCTAGLQILSNRTYFSKITLF